MKIIYTNSEGNLCVVHPAKGKDINAIFAKVIPEGVTDAKIVESSAIPTDKTFRNAWVKSNQAIETDFPKAKEIAHDCRRCKRSELFAPLDIEVSIPSKATAAESARQAIRETYDDIQEDIDAATTESGLKSVLVDSGVL
tara:strand:- start:2639 stop:3058 length:420 start_codon:yes stop_codon:yes gene_type:complete